MSRASDWLENKLVDFIFRGRAWTPPTPVYLALFTASPTDAGGGTEVTGGAYARVEIIPDYDVFKSTQGTSADEASTGDTGETTNATVFQFPTPTADWGTVTHWAIFDASSAGNMVIWGPLVSTKSVQLGQLGPGFAEDALTITVR